MSDHRLPYDIRASFSRLMLHLHVMRGSPITAVRHARLWRDIPDTVDVAGYHANAQERFVDSGPARSVAYDRFRNLIKVVDVYLDGLRMKYANGEVVLSESAANCSQNRLTYEVGGGGFVWNDLLIKL